MWPLEHCCPQPPQLAGSELALISQPSRSLFMLQSTKPWLHAPLQTPFPQLGLATWLLEQSNPQPPQLAGSELELISQPSRSLFMLQSTKPWLQAPLQTPFPQLGL